jgi:plasmid stabilization system protein ParE
MIYQVLIQPTAEEDLLAIYRRAAKAAPISAGRWLDRFRDSLQSLTTNPTRCPLARESQRVELELREFHFGRYPNVIRVLFTIESDMVFILRIRRAQRRALSENDLQELLRREDENDRPTLGE